MKTVSLVLGSGGARGLAHIGVIHWLEENGYSIEFISGCSMGNRLIIPEINDKSINLLPL